MWKHMAEEKIYGVHVIKLDLIMIKVYYLLKYNRKCTQ